ncbi:MAG: hypothetical protein RL037_1754 [Bacteroidota bacterium]
MKNACLILSAVLMTAISVSSCGEGASKGEDTPMEVTVEKQVWMTQNLNVDKFRNGDPIPIAKTDEDWEKAGTDGKPAWCYYDNDPKNGIKYGKLYNWYAVNDSRGLAPAGWHIPTDAEWTILSDYLGGEDAAGTKMKSTSGWENYGCKKCDGGSSEYKKICSACKGTQSNSSEPFSGNGTNSSGFSGLPGGYRDSGPFDLIGRYGKWWSSTEGGAGDAWSRELGCNYGSVDRGDWVKTVGFSVRCLRD